MSVNIYNRIPDYLTKEDPDTHIFSNPLIGVVKERQDQNGCQLAVIKATPEGVIYNNSDLLFQQIVEILGSLYLYTDLVVAQNFELFGDVHFVNNLNVDGNLTVGVAMSNSLLKLYGDETISRDLSVGTSLSNGAITLYGTLIVTGTAGGSEFFTDLHCAANFQVDETTTLNGLVLYGSSSTLDHIPQITTYNTTFFSATLNQFINGNVGLNVDLTSWNTNTTTQAFGTFNASTGVFTFSKTGNYQICIRGSWDVGAFTVFGLPSYLWAGVHHSTHGTFGGMYPIFDDTIGYSRLYTFSLPYQITSGDAITFRVGTSRIVDHTLTASDYFLTVVNAEIYRIN